VEDQILWGFHRLEPLKGVKVQKVISGNSSCTCIAIDVDGQCYIWGRNSSYQLGLDHATNTYNPTMLTFAENTKIKGGACGPSHTLLFSTDGRLFAAGMNDCGQLGAKHAQARDGYSKVFVEIDVPGVQGGIVDASCGRDFSMVVDAAGNLYSFGSPQYGCLGNGTNGEKLEKANKITYTYVTTPTRVSFKTVGGDIAIQKVASGTNHTCAVDQEGRIYTWGFGAYGRLGHSKPADLTSPQAVELFSKEPPPPNLEVPAFMRRSQAKIRASQVTCGATSTYVTARGSENLYMFGICKKSGEANMYPKLSDEVSGWKIRSISCGQTSTCVASGTSLITWGPSPCFGELGYGEGNKKSSTVSDSVTDLEDATCFQVASGQACTLVIVDTEDSDSAKKLEKLPTFAPDELVPGSGEGPEAGGKKRGRPGAKGKDAKGGAKAAKKGKAETKKGKGKK
jgi:alpha-tubulin suppressor-like RCC1 family protein